MQLLMELLHYQIGFSVNKSTCWYFQLSVFGVKCLKEILKFFCIYESFSVRISL